MEPGSTVVVGAGPAGLAAASMLGRRGIQAVVLERGGAVILTVVLPQFADPARGHVPLQLLLLGCIFLAIGLASDSAWAIAAGSARVWLARSRGRLEALAGAGGLVLIRLGVRLAVTGRRLSP